MKEKIFSEMRRLNFATNHVWKFKDYIGFVEKFNPLERIEFYEVMQGLCDDGIFIAENDGATLAYRLTEKGVQKIYN